MASATGLPTHSRSRTLALDGLEPGIKGHVQAANGEFIDPSEPIEVGSTLSQSN